jgi:hypothetical protein
MARTDFVQRTKDYLYGQGLGETPAIRRLAADPSVTVSAPVVTFDMVDAAEAAKIKPGNTLQWYGSADDTDAYAFYVLSVSTATVTAVNGYRGSPVIANASNDLDGQLLEQNPLALEFHINKKIDTIFARYLWPEAYELTTATIASPDLSDAQEALPADVERIVSAYQIIGGEAIRIGYAAEKNVHSTVATNNVLGSFDYIDGSALYYTYMSKLALADDATDDALTDMVAMGAAALMLGASASEMTLEATRKDSQIRAQLPAAREVLWQDFLTLRNAYSEDLATDTALGFEIHRG